MADFVALVPLRGGSKSVPDKNIRLIAGKPLCAWVLEAACNSGMFTRVVVSTDSPHIAAVVRQLGLPVEILDRPAEFATDSASTESVMLHAASVLDFDVLVTIQATSPLVMPDDFRQASRLFVEGNYDSMLTAVRVKRFFWREDATALNYDPMARPRRQDFPGSFMENGAFYFTRKELLRQTHCRLGGRIGIYEMPEETAVEIDEPGDWEVVQRLLLYQHEAAHDRRLADVRLLVVDVDGTLTDAGMYWSADGEMLKKFNTRDAKGLELIRKLGVNVAIITAENSPIVVARAAKLGIEQCYVGVADKREQLLDLVRASAVSLSEVAYIGDDCNDLECMQIVGFSACPRDAVEAVKKVAHSVSTFPGGSGAVREICDRIMNVKKGKLRL